MKLYQLFYLPNQRYAAVIAGLAGVVAGTLVDWVSVSAAQVWESALVGVLASLVFVTTPLRSISSRGCGRAAGSPIPEACGRR